MKITFEVDDPQLFLSAMNNAIIAYNNLYGNVYLNCDVPLVFERFFNKNNIFTSEARSEFIRKRLEILQKVYNKINNGTDIRQ